MMIIQSDGLFDHWNCKQVLFEDMEVGITQMLALIHIAGMDTAFWMSG